MASMPGPPPELKSSSMWSFGGTHISLFQERARKADAKPANLRTAAIEALNNDAPTSLITKAHQLLNNTTSVRDFSRALDNIYNLSTIEVLDTGSGMSATDLMNNFLVIGTASRKREVDKALARGATKAPFLGEKGIGRLSAMRLGNRLTVITARKQDSKLNLLEIDWSRFDQLDVMLEDINVKPRSGGGKPKPDWSGTRIVVGALSEDWAERRLERIAKYDFARLTDPFLDQKQRPRVALFWNGKRLSIPWMDQRLLDHAHARVKGHYEIVDGTPQLRCLLEAIDLGFDHPPETENVLAPLHDIEATIIGISQDIPDTALTSVGPCSFEAHWYNRRRLGAIDGIGELKTVRELQERWSGILLFRDGFRVFPYGDDDDDWLGLDRKGLRRSGYALNKTQFIGRVAISRTANPALLDQTNREGLRETPEQQVLLGLMQYVIQDLLFPFLKNVERQYKDQKVDLAEAKTEVARLETRAKTALKQLRSLAPHEAKDSIDALQQTIFEFSEFAKRARQRIEEVEQESHQMIEMAGVGLMVEVVAHELARASEKDVLQLSKSGQRMIGQVDRAPSHAATSNSLLMN